MMVNYQPDIMEKGKIKKRIMASLLLMVLFTSFSYSQDQTEELPDFSLMATNGQIYTQV